MGSKQSQLLVYTRISRLRDEKEVEIYKLDLEDRFGRISDEDADTVRFFELLKVKLRAQHLAVSEVAVEKGQLKFRLSPQTPLDPAKLMACVGQKKGAAFSPDGAVRLTLLGTVDGPMLQAQRMLTEWAGLKKQIQKEFARSSVFRKGNKSDPWVLTPYQGRLGKETFTIPFRGRVATVRRNGLRGVN